ncbi:uncharacterized protein LOC110605595 [Manihot esculenta]|uniref:Xylanase inhibitor C-terminal domain-containing protein n=1 Tax=Manihot esculenta TaxID=3983 RepID=A0A2C9U4J0_MANES|nr:uncharacterized protein LOC110605595 [Manihot esculenta]OAY24628.1 hypothetical protein MANES_17G030900v8 [Manihot esculenta]
MFLSSTMSLTPKSFPFPFLSLLLLLLLTLSASASSSSIQNLLHSQGLPGGLFPENVKSFELDRNGRLEVHLDGPCLAKYETRVYFDSVVRANLSYGGLVGLEGLSQEELFLWFPVKGIIVSDPSSGLILFDIGLAHKQLSRSLFEDPPVCKPQGALLDNFGRKMGVAVQR